jgi:hypothetical protein
MKKVLKLMTLLVSVLAISVAGGGQAFAAWDPNQTALPNVYDPITSVSGVGNLKDLKETSSLVASKTWQGWYYTTSDRVKLEGDPQGQDDYTTCTPLGTATLRDNCRMTERAKVWMVHMAYDSAAPNYRKIDQVRSFPISNSAWAYNRNIAFNGDWEDMSQGPVRTVGGVSTNSLLIAATGKDTGNGNCNSRRIIEFNELNPYSAAGTTWSPTYIYDLNGATISPHQSDCNIEALWLDFTGTTPYAYMTNYGTTNGGATWLGNKIFRRVLTTTTGRSAATGFNSGTPITPSGTEFSLVGSMSTSGGKTYQISGAGFQESNDDLVMISSNNSTPGTGGCKLLMWHSRSYTTTTNPNEYPGCGIGNGIPSSSTTPEGISYVYSTDPDVKSVHMLYDEADNLNWYHKYYYWLP